MLDRDRLRYGSREHVEVTKFMTDHHAARATHAHDHKTVYSLCFGNPNPAGLRAESS